MAMERWDPFRDMLTLREAMDRLFQESFVRPTSAMISAARGTIPVDLAESGDNYVIRATMPGIDPDKLQISIHENVLTMRGEGKGEEERKEENYILRERHAASFSRSIALPTSVDAEHAQASYENGVLTLTIPKSPAAKPRQIPIGKAQAAQPLPTDTRAAQQAPSATQPSTPQAQTGAPQQERIDESSRESFPASDSPSWSPSSSGR